MKVRTFLFISLAMGVLFALVKLLHSNQDVHTGQMVRFWGGVDLNVGLTLVVFFALGIAIALVFGITREASMLMEERRRRKMSRKGEAIEEEYSRGLTAVLEGRNEEALGHFRKILEIDSRHFNTLLKLGEVLRSQGKVAEAIEYHQKAHHLKEDDTRPLYELVEDYEAKGDLDRARVLLGKIIAVKKNSVLAWRKLRSLHRKEGNWAKALEAQEKVEKYVDRNDHRDAADPGVGVGLRYEIASEQLGRGQTREAIAALRKILKDEPRFIPAHVRLGEALRQEGPDTEAVEAWFRGFELTGSPVFLTVLEEHFLQREQPMGAIEALKRCMTLARKDTLPRFYLGKLYFRLEMLDDALAVLRTLEGRASYAPTLHYLLGRIHERRKNFLDASSEYRKVIKEMDLVQLEYRCKACGETFMDWFDRCRACDAWNTVEVNFREEISPDDLGLSTAPVYTSRH